MIITPSYRVRCTHQPTGYQSPPHPPKKLLLSRLFPSMDRHFHIAQRRSSCIAPNQDASCPTQFAHPSTHQPFLSARWTSISHHRLPNFAPPLLPNHCNNFSTPSFRPTEITENNYSRSEKAAHTSNHLTLLYSV